MTTTDDETMPFSGPALQLGSILPALAMLSTSGVSESATMSAFWPAMTARLCAPLAPYEPLNMTPLPADVFSKPSPSASYADFTTEKPTTLIVLSPDDDPPPESSPPPQPARPTATAAATASRALRPGRAVIGELLDQGAISISIVISIDLVEITSVPRAPDKSVSERGTPRPLEGPGRHRPWRPEVQLRTCRRAPS